MWCDLLLGTSAAGLWLAWPGSDLVVVLDGASARFAAADRIGHALLQPPRRLLIRCPRDTPAPQPTPELHQGFDTATQITALAHWLRHQRSPRIGLADLPTPSPSEHRKLLTGALRLTLWRATGSTGAWLVPQIVASKWADCGV
jgi:hypothetical protein